MVTTPPLPDLQDARFVLRCAAEHLTPIYGPQDLAPPILLALADNLPALYELHRLHIVMVQQFGESLVVKARMEAITDAFLTTTPSTNDRKQEDGPQANDR